MFRRAVAAGLAAAALVVGLVTPAQAEVPGEDPLEGFEVSDFEAELPPPLDSEALELAAPAETEGVFAVPAGTPEDAEAVPDDAVDFPGLDDVDLEDAASVERSEFSNEYVFADGYGVVMTGQAPLNVESDGGWVPISTEAELQTDGSWEADLHPLNPEFPAVLDEGPALSISDGVFTADFTLEDAEPATPSVGGDEARRAGAKGSEPEASSELVYEGAFEGIDLTYAISNGAVKETLILAEAPAPGEGSWSWLLEAPGLELVVGDSGELLLIDELDEVRFSIPRPYAWDSSGIEGEQEPADLGTDWSVDDVDVGVWRIGLTIADEWLLDPARVYPVYIDPTANYGDSNVTSYKSDGATRTDGVLIGNSRSGGSNTYWRAKVRYNY